MQVVEQIIIKLEKIEAPRQPFRHALTRSFLDDIFRDVPTYTVEHPAELTSHLTRVGERDVLLEGATVVTLRSECRRCLRAVQTELPVKFTLNLVARRAELAGSARDEEDSGEGEQAGTFGDTDVDEELFDGETIDLLPLVREQVLLGLPAIEPLCTEACRGLCTTCGQDLNEADCGHSQKVLDPRWAALKNIKV